MKSTNTHPPKKAANAKKWVHYIVRHTSITFQTERDKNEALTAYANGSSIQMMNRHYRDTIDGEKAIREFLGLTQAVLMTKPLKVELPANKHHSEFLAGPNRWGKATQKAIQNHSLVT